jgi:hypothetical protein
VAVYSQLHPVEYGPGHQPAAGLFILCILNARVLMVIGGHRLINDLPGNSSVKNARLMLSVHYCQIVNYNPH